MSDDIGAIKKCPLCEAAFGCKPAACWCSALPAVMPVAAGADCYCPQCLQVMVTEQLAKAGE